MNKYDHILHNLKQVRDELYKVEGNGYSVSNIEDAFFSLNKVDYPFNEPYNEHIGMLRMEVIDAIDRGDLKEDLNDTQIDKIIDILMNDDKLWDVFYDELSEVLYNIHNDPKSYIHSPVSFIDNSILPQE